MFQNMADNLGFSVEGLRDDEKAFGLMDDVVSTFIPLSMNWSGN